MTSAGQVKSTDTLFKGNEPTYGEEDGHVTYRCNGRPGRRKIIPFGYPDYTDNSYWIPVIDFTNCNHPDLSERREVAAQLALAAERSGFWYAANVPISQELIEEVFDVVEEFFALPLEAKEECSWTKSPGSQGFESFEVSAVNEGAINPYAQVRESFAMSHSLSREGLASTPGSRGKGNRFPPAMPNFKQVLDRYYTEAAKFAITTLQLFALELGVNEEDLFRWQAHPNGAIRPAHYPPQDPTEKAIGHLAHTDSTFFTMVLQASKSPPGLEVLDANGQWIQAPYLPSAAFACNVGDFLEHWSDGRFRSTVHRVLNAGDRSRYSVPFFFSPDPHSIIKPVVGPGQKRKTPKEEYEERPVGYMMIRRFMYGRRNHPTAQRVLQLGIPEAEWKYDFLVDGVPEPRIVC